VDSFGFLSYCSSGTYSHFQKVLQLVWTVDSGQNRALGPGRSFSSCSDKGLIFGKLIRVSTEVAALRALPAAVVLTTSELVLFAKIALTVQGVFTFGGRGGPAA